MKRGVKLLLLLGALALCALAGALLARWNAANEAAEQAAAARTSTPLLPIQRGELAAMRYTYAGNTVSLKLERGTWSLADDADFAVDQTAASTMAGALTALSASRAFSGGSDLAQYGLEQPTLTVTAEAADGETHTYALGDMSSVTYEYYLAADGEQTVYLVDAALKNAFSLTRADLAQKDDIPLFTDVRGVATAYPDGRAYTLRYDAESAGWARETPDGVSYLTDAETAEKSVRRIASLAWRRCAAYALTDAERAAYGLDEPMEITITYAVTTELGGAAEEETLRAFTFCVGSALGEYRYACLPDGEMAYLIDASVAEAAERLAELA